MMRRDRHRPFRVCAVMVTADRPTMALSVIRQFEAQTYADKHLMVLDTGTRDRRDPDAPVAGVFGPNVRLWAEPALRGTSYGALLNIVCSHALTWCAPDAFAIMDDDDWSAPERLLDQVDLLETTRSEVSGYHAMYFVDQRDGRVWEYVGDQGYVIGASLMFRVGYWSRRPFIDQMIGADSEFIKGETFATADARSPLMMVARIHEKSICAREGHRKMNRFLDSDAEGFRLVTAEPAFSNARAVFA